MKDRESPDGVLEVMSLIRNIYVRTVKMKVTVSKDTAAVEEVVDLRDDEGTGKAEAGVKREASKKLFKGSAVGVVDVPKGDVEGWFGVAGVGAGDEGGDAEEAGLVGVGRDDSARVVGISLELEDRRKRWGILNKLRDSEKF